MRLDFAAVLLMLTALSGAVWVLDSLVLAPRRRQAGSSPPGVLAGSENRPKLVEYARSFFPIFLAVLLLRSFLVEPFRIPSGSMMPTLLIGDFILVNKFAYGLRLPVLDTKVLEIGQPQRGDVVVFRYPEDPSVPFIKRVVGLPGDRVAYFNKVLYVNGEPASQQPAGVYTGAGSGSVMTGADVRVEHLTGRSHQILVQNGAPSVEGQLVVPEGHYFVLGDNRDNSRDSRYWGTVPDENLVGRAFLIWMSWDWGGGTVYPGRIGDGID
jgi:signal peptidase I